MSARVLMLPHPFDTRGRRQLALPAGSRLLEALPPGEWAVTVNGRPVRGEVLPALELADGDLVAARVVVGDPATAALIVYTLVKATAAYFIGASVAASVIGIAAGAAAAYFTAKALAPDASKLASAPAGQPFFSVAGTRNQLRPYASLPQHYGELRVVPDLCAPLLTSVSPTAEQTVRGLFCIGVGRYSFSSADVLIGVTAASSIGLQDFEQYSGLEDADPPSERLKRFATNVFEAQLGLQLHHEADSVVEQISTTTENALSFDVVLVFPSGIWRISDSGRQQIAAVRLVVRYREVGATDWVSVFDGQVRGFIPEKFSRLYHVDPPGAAQYEVSVALHAVMSRGLYTEDRGGSGGSTALTGDAVWISLRSYLLGDAIIDARTSDVTMFGLALQASELVTGTLDQVSVKAFRVLPTWTEADGWSDVDLGERNPAAYTATRNPAWEYANELRAAGVPDDEIDAPQLLAWADFCTAAGWACNWQNTDELPLEEALRTIASAGRAFPAPRGGLRSVVWDDHRDPVAAFGPHNARDLVMTQASVEEIDGLRVRFVNTRDADGRLDERTIYFNGHSESTAEVYRTLDVMNGLTDPVLVERYVRFERLKAERRSFVYEWIADWSAAVVDVGDVVLLLYRGMRPGSEQSECTGYSTRDAGAHIDELFCYPAVRVEAGRTYVVRVRTRARGASGGYRVLLVPIENTVLAGVQNLTALTVDGDVDVPVYEDDDEAEQSDDLVGQPLFAGEPDDGEVMVTEIRFTEAGQCVMQAVDFAREIFDEVLLETPHEGSVSPQELANLRPDAPVLSSPVTSRITGYAGSGYGYHAVYEFQIPLAPAAAFPPLAYYRVQYRWHTYIPPAPDLGERGSWTDGPTYAAPVSRIVISDFGMFRGVDLRVWSVSVAGAPSEPLFIPGSELRAMT